jgi:hypothetical protein
MSLCRMTLPGCVLPKRGCAVVEAKDGQVAVLTAALERERRLGLRLAEVERRLGMDVTDSGTPSSKERIGVNRPGGRGSSPSGSAARTVGGAGSPVTREED